MPVVCENQHIAPLGSYRALPHLMIRMSLNIIDLYIIITLLDVPFYNDIWQLNHESRVDEEVCLYRNICLVG